MLTRREYLKLSAAAGVALAINPRLLLAQDAPQALITRTIPGTSEQLPVVGLGSSASFARIAGEGELDRVRAVLEALLQHGGRVFDTAPGYGVAEEVAGGVVREAGLGERLFWATKLNVAGRGGDAADPAAARAQLEQSFARIGKSPIDLVQVHNMGDVPTQLGILEEQRDAGRIRYLGATTTSESQYDALEALMKTGRLDFIGVDYAVDNRTMEERIFPLARERGIGVLVYQPFGRTRLWQKVEGHALPDWAADYDIATWGQFFLKFAVSHPAVTAATPSTSQARNMIDNMGAARGRLPDEAGRRRMVAHVEALG
ncbi:MULTISPECIES: aldo/keto reductase [unclassified Luteimonas]|uniref:aldo/keto reductase n=1 Tax=unclassified Luteimonas TaxID=2629088 RepID=UPI0018F0D373|nr:MULTISPECIES: aldo/keto reductase [unclassified Luteimonas]MBJ6979787.1 aldo/keto reductase [Luteimonas sp. MC1895]MBJ6985521.1 aldo/keto reductase [Luteimonas sp. MC1750]QQO05993.1 aldo/keto reductase [Luteimonas sp. MC1750]